MTAAMTPSPPPSSPPSSSPTTSRRSSRVRFGTVTVTLFPMILGNNPACSEGVPVQLGPTPMGETITQKIDLYEYFRKNEQMSQNSHKRKSSRRRSSSTSHFCLSVQRRASILLQAGYTIEDIAGVTHEMHKLKQQRSESFSSSSDRWMQLLQKTGKLPRYIVQGVLTTAGKTVSTAGKTVSTVIRKTGAVAVAGGNALLLNSLVSSTHSKNGSDSNAANDGGRSQPKLLQARSA